MKAYLNKHWLIVLSFGFIFIIITIISQYSEIRNLNSRIDTININFKRLADNDSSLVSEIKFMQFKEDSYLKQLDRDTNLILWFIAIVFGLFGLISYASFNRRVGILEKEINNKYESHISELELLKEGLYNTKADLKYDSSDLNNKMAEDYYKDKKYANYVLYNLLSCSQLSVYYLFHKNKNNTTLAESSYGDILARLNHIKVKISGLENKPKIKKEEFTTITKEIRKIEEHEIIKLISKIHTLIELNE